MLPLTYKTETLSVILSAHILNSATLKLTTSAPTNICHCNQKKCQKSWNTPSVTCRSGLACIHGQCVLMDMNIKININALKW